MGASLNIVFKKKVSPYGHMSDDHNALGNGLEKLDKVLTKAGIPTLGQFVSCDPEEWMDMDDEDPDAEGMPPEQWFEPADGLEVVRVVMSHLRAKPKAISWSKDALLELEQVEAELVAAASRKAQFHFQFCD